MKRILIVGAGYAGAVHARLLADAGYKVHVIDKRPHIAGNAYDRVDENGVRLHVYGPHLFHSKNKNVIGWIKQFGDFVPYTHKVRALLPDGQEVPLPINLDTVNAVFGTSFETAEEVQAHLRKVSLPIAEPANAAEYLYANIGKDLTDLFFRPYTKKMWGFDLEDMEAAVVKRIPLRFDRTDTYFADDEIQMMPRDGYVAVFEALFAHPGITVSLNTAFSKDMLADYDFCFNSMPIDEYFGAALGELPYRSLRFHHRTVEGVPEQDWSVTNFTDTGKFTRETAWHVLPHHLVEDTGRHTRTKEEPCDYRDNNMERYYPVKTADGRYVALYEKYKVLAASEPKMQFIGRCGTYQYLDMDQVINQSLISAEKWLAAQKATA
ncbi:MAG: UDP-galactopyranose mutase [Acidocella sp.]|nr:UDP-galactopyranose mutase [Acidocella sp.]